MPGDTHGHGSVSLVTSNRQLLIPYSELVRQIWAQSVFVGIWRRDAEFGSDPEVSWLTEFWCDTERIIESPQRVRKPRRIPGLHFMVRTAKKSNDPQMSWWTERVAVGP